MGFSWKSAFSVAMLWAGSASAHPHAFVTTSMVFDLNDKQFVTGVTMTWEYDEFFSLLIFEDMGLDKDGDGQLTKAELKRLKGFDLVEWPDGFEGDLYLWSNGKKVEMPRPTPFAIAVDDGRIVATQKRKIPAVPAEGLTIKQYDPTYYVAYDLSGGIDVPAPCAVRITKADDAKAEKEIAKLIKKYSQSENVFLEADLGYLYADTVALTCGG